MLFEYLARLRTRSRSERRAYALSASLAITGVVVLVWLSVLLFQDGFGNYRFSMKTDTEQVTPVETERDLWRNMLKEEEETEPVDGLAEFESWFDEAEQFNANGTSTGAPYDSTAYFEDGEYAASGTSTTTTGIGTSSTPALGGATTDYATTVATSSQTPEEPANPFAPSRLVP